MCQSAKKVGHENVQFGKFMKSHKSGQEVPTPEQVWMLEQKPWGSATKSRLKFYKDPFGMLHDLVTGD